ncbi:MAG: dienelactone hydrolase family protein [Armatimonadetes bacterium]|jgi:carboxymethylenebutenolidase|nr:dienelactone hydrolase family protein [Armatimonadota bacterium]
MASEPMAASSKDLTRREFLAAAGGALLAGEVLAAAPAAVEAERVTYHNGTMPIGANLYRPQAEGPHPGLVVIHENRGLTDYIAETARQLAQAGYVALAPNLVSRKLGPDAPGGTDAAMAALRELSTEDALSDLGAALTFLKARPEVRADRLGCVGFCYGGRLSLLLACHQPDLDACVVFYGRPGDALPLIPQLRAPVLAHYGEKDSAIPVAAAKELEETLRRHGKVHEVYIYPGAGHAFHRPGGPNYHPDAARAAWQRTLDWFARYLAA